MHIHDLFNVSRMTFKLFLSCCHLPNNTKLNLFPSRFSDNTLFFCSLIPENLSTFSKIGKLFLLVFILLDVQVVVQIFVCPRITSIRCQLHNRPREKDTNWNFHYTKCVFSGYAFCKCWHEKCDFFVWFDARFTRGNVCVFTYHEKSEIWNWILILF